MTYKNTQVAEKSKKMSLNEEIKQNPARFLRKTSKENIEKPRPKEKVEPAEIAPIKDLLHDEIVKRMSKKDILKKHSANDLKKAEIYINAESTPSEVTAFLRSKDFSEKYV